MLALLLLHANEVVSTDRLIDELWGDAPPESAANMLQGYVSHLRKELEPTGERGKHGLIVSRQPGYVLQVGPDQVDAERFERLASEGRRLLDDGDADAAAARLGAALALWRGRALDDLAYEPFAQNSIERLEELRLQTLEDRIDADLAVSRHNALIGELRELVDQHPLRERLRAQLMTALYRCGRQADALEVYREGRRVLRDELGIEPGPALRELEQSILRQDPALGAAVAAPPPIIQGRRRRWPLLTAGVVVAVAAITTAVVGRSSAITPIAVNPHSVAVIDPAHNTVVADIATGDYPTALAADGRYVYVANFGDATVSRVLPMQRKLYDTFALSRASDMVAGDRQLSGRERRRARAYATRTWQWDDRGDEPRPDDQDIPCRARHERRRGTDDDRRRRFRLLTVGWKPGQSHCPAIHLINRQNADHNPGIAPGGVAVVGNSSAGRHRLGQRPAHATCSRESMSMHAPSSVASTYPTWPRGLAADNGAVWLITRDRNGRAERRRTSGNETAVRRF